MVKQSRANDPMMLPYFEKMLLESDDVLFLHAACHVFALALRDSFGYPLRMVRDTTAALPNGATHVFCGYDESRGVDVCGLFEVRQFLHDERWHPLRYTTESVSNPNLQPYCTCTFGGGLYIESSFVTLARSRADKRIAEFHDYYSGHHTQPVPGLKRVQKVPFQSIFN